MTNQTMPRIFLVYCVSASIFPMVALAGAATTLNDTGQNQCYDGSNMATCSESNTGDGSRYPRQDGQFGRDAQVTTGKLTKIGAGAAGFDYTKIANNGTALPASAELGSKTTD